MRELNKAISRVRLKIRFVFFLNWLLESYLYLSVLYIVNYFFHLNISYYYLLIPVFLAIILSLVRPIDDRDVAIVIDKDLGLDERVITSLEFSRLDSPIVKGLISETLILLRNLDIKKVYPLRIRKRLKYLLLIPTLVFLSLFLYQNVFYPRGMSSPVTEETRVSRINTDLLNLQQKLVSERPDLAKRLEILRKDIEERKVTSKEGLNILKEITKEIDKTPSGGMDSNTRADIKRMLELVMNKMGNKESTSGNNNETPQGREFQEDSREGTGKKGLESSKDEVSDGREVSSSNTSEEDSSDLTDGFGREQSGADKQQSGVSSMRGSSEGSAGDSKEGKEKEGASAGGDTVEEGGTLPGKGERENKLGEESSRNQTQATPQYVPGIPKEEGSIKLRIKSLGKETSPTVEREDLGSPIKSPEDPIKKESVPYEYKEKIRHYFERLKGE